MDNQEEEVNEAKPFQRITAAQKSLLRELCKNFRRPGYTERDETRGHWETVANRLNALEGPKKTALRWRKIWWVDKARKYKKNELLKEKLRQKEQMVTKECESGVQKRNGADFREIEKINTQTNNGELSMDFLHKHSKIKDRGTLNEISTLNAATKDKEFSALPQEGIKSETLIAIASTLHDIKTNNIVSDMRMVTKHKLHLLLCVDDYHERLLPVSRMSITDWLLFDTVLVHEPFDVIQVSEFSKVDPLTLMDLFDLVNKYNAESLMGEQLALAWAAITLEYNKKGRMCTPMLLQRRWYQLKLATKERFIYFQHLLMKPGVTQEQLKACKPTPLQTLIIARYKSLLTKPFMSWEERINHKLVILRDQFESIALRKRNMPDISEAAIIPVPETIDLTDKSPTKETGSLQKLGEFETITVEQTNQNMYIDENDPCDEQEVYGATQLNNIPFNNATPDDIEMQVPYNTIQVDCKPEPVLPKITNIFGNVHVPIEKLPEISEIAKQVANNKNIVVNETKVLNEQSNANSPEDTIADIKDEPIDSSDDSYQLVDVKMEISEEEIGQMKRENDTHENVTGNEKNLLIDTKLRMTPMVKTVKLDDMGILPIDLLTHVNNKDVIDIINVTSKPVMTNTDTKMDMVELKKVNLSSALFKKPRNCTYSYKKLSKNPDFNIVLKKLNHRFFKSESNRLLLRACKPLCVDISKAFESKLINGRLYLKTDVVECKEENKNDSVVPLTSVELNMNANIDNTTAGKAHENLSILPKPNESVMHPLELISNNSNNIANMAFQKFLKQKHKLNSEPHRFDSKSLNLNAIPNSTVDVLLSIIADVGKTKPTPDPISLEHMGDIITQVINETDSNSRFIAVNPIPDYKKISHCCWARQKIEAFKTQGNVPIHTCFQRCSCCCKDVLAVLTIHMNPKLIKFGQTDKEIVNSMQTSSTQINKPSNEHKKLNKILPKTDTVKLKPESIQLNNPQNNKVNSILANILQNYPKKRLKERGSDSDVKMILGNFTEPSIDKLVYLGKNKILLTTTKIPKHFKKFLRFQNYIEKVVTLPKGMKLVLQPNGQALLQSKFVAGTEVDHLVKLKELVDEFNKMYSTDTSQCSNNIENDKSKTPDAREIHQESNTTNLNVSTKVNFQSNGPNVETVKREDLTVPSGSQQSIQPNQKHPNFVHAVQSCLGPLLRKTLSPIQLVSELKYAYSQKGLFFKLDLDNASLVPMNLRMSKNKTAAKSKTSKPVRKRAKTTIPTETKSKQMPYVSFENPVTGKKESILNIEASTINSNVHKKKHIQTINKDAESMEQQHVASESINDQQLPSIYIKQEPISSESINSEIDMNINDSNATQLTTDTRMEEYENEPTLPITETLEIIIKKEQDLDIDIHDETICDSERGMRFTCDQCPESYMRSISLQKHKLVVHGQDGFSCNDCERQFFSKTLLTSHLRTEHRDYT